MKPCVDEHLDIAGVKISELTPFQAIRNLFKGLFWASHLVSKKIEHVEKLKQPITVDPKELLEELKKMEAVLFTWDKLIITFVDALLAADEKKLNELREKMKGCDVTCDIDKAFRAIPDDLPALPIYLIDPKEVPTWFSPGKFIEHAYIRKLGVFTEGYKKNRAVFEKNLHKFRKIFQESADDIMKINKDINY